MESVQLHEDGFLRILWDAKRRMISVHWKDATATMTGEDFKRELALIPGHVEERKAQGLLVDVSHFGHKMSPEVQQWRVRNISSRYNAAGLQRFAFLFPNVSQIPQGMNQSSEGEAFLTRAFTGREEAVTWLAG